MSLAPDEADQIASEVMYLNTILDAQPNRYPFLLLVTMVRELLRENEERRDGGDLLHAPPSATEKALRNAVLIDQDIRL